MTSDLLLETELGTTAGPCPADGGLAALVAPLDSKDFLRDWLGRRPLLVRGPERRFAGIFGWDDLNRALGSARVDPTRMHLVRAAQGIALANCAEPVPQLAARGRPSRLHPGRLGQALGGGATLAVDGVEELHPPLRRLVGGVEQELGSLVQANLYANLGGAQPGFDTHWDDHDVLVLQVEGAKHWELYPPTEPFPVGVLSDPPPPDGDPLWSGTLTEGDLLYLPRGWWHTVRAVEGPSLHLTLSSRLPSAGDLLRKLLARVAVTEPVVRQDLPRFADAPAAERWYAELRESLLRAVREPGLLESLAAALDAGPPARPDFRLPAGPAEAPGES